MLATENLREADRLMTVCNACRYCEGLCAVFPAMEMRRTFAAADLNYLANLCHQCGACYPDCQYSPPHEFDVNVPATLAKLRNDSYADYAWPRALAGAFERNGLVIASLLARAERCRLHRRLRRLRRSRRAVVAQRRRFLQSDAAPGHGRAVRRGLALRDLGLRLQPARLLARHQRRCAARWLCRVLAGLADTLTLRYLGGGGGGCTSRNEQPSNARRLYHHATFYGFLLCFAATSVATLYHYVFGWHAPYALYSLPVLLGIVGGFGLLVGPAGLYLLSRAARPPSSPIRPAPAWIPPSSPCCT